ncbi:MAG TPA: nicotinate (nicotinamide) nucleotide adenylyltransferase [Saprospiraceae bacterium]|nr:nicotinate (nicotinamide) nucleotide adenylyltransferase [Saprospiraceae bacterium]
MENTSKKQQIGLFFGSFNPIHVGHLIIANHMLNCSHLDQIWMVVTPQNPLKSKASLALDYDRLKMVELAIGDNTRIRASNIEFSLPKPSFTIDTLTYLSEKYPTKQFTLIMGADNLSTIDKWKNYNEILEGYGIVVYKREGSEPKLPNTVVGKFNVSIIDAPLLDISSTFIRSLSKENKSIRYFVNDEVYNYIKERGLYQN